MRHPIIIFIFASIFILIPCSYAQYEPGSLFTAARSGDLDTVKKLLNEQTTQETLNNALGAAVVGDQIEAIKFLVERGAQVNHLSSWETPLLTNAIMSDHIQAAQTLIELGADVNTKGYRKLDQDIYIDWQWTPLMCAGRKGHLPLIKSLIKHKARIDEVGWSQSADDLETATDIAAYSGHLEALKFLLKNGGEIHTNTLFKVVRGGHLEILKYILPRKFDINQAGTFQDRTLLMEAAWWGHEDITAFLIQKKADLNKRDKFGLTALQHAKNENHPQIYELLKNNGAQE